MLTTWYQRLAVVLLAVNIAGIGCQSRARLAAELEKGAAPLLLPGYSDFRFEAGDVDVGRFIYSYRIPAGMKTEDVIGAVTIRLRTLRPCYKVIRESSVGAHLRCQDAERSRRFEGIEEFGYRFVAGKGRLYVLEIIDVPPNPERYETFLQSFEDMTKS